MLERQKRKIIEAVSPSLEPGENVQAVFIGQTPIPQILYLLVAPLLFVFIIKFKTFVATDRNLYVFPNAWMRTYKYAGPPHKVPLDQARVESGSMWIRVDDGPKVWAPPFGPIKRGMTEVRDAVARAQPGVPQATP